MFLGVLSSQLPEAEGSSSALAVIGETRISGSMVAVDAATVATVLVSMATIMMVGLFLGGVLCGCSGPRLLQAAWRTVRFFCGPAWAAPENGQGRPSRSVSVQAPCTYLWEWEGNERSRRFYAEGQGFRHGGKVWLRNRHQLPPPFRREVITARPYTTVANHDGDSDEE